LAFPFSIVARHDSAEEIPEIAAHLSGARNDSGVEKVLAMTKGKGASNDKGKGSFHNSPAPSYLKRGRKGRARNDRKMGLLS